MNNLILFNKPYGVISQFRERQGKTTLKSFIDHKGFYPAGRLDEHSEGLLLLTNNGALQARIANPAFKLPKTYLVQVEGVPDENALTQLALGVVLKDGKTKRAKVRKIEPPDIAPREPPIRERKNIPTCWISMTITEGKNRQVRRMTAAVGHPTLRLYRSSIGHWDLKGLPSGAFKMETVNLPKR